MPPQDPGRFSIGRQIPAHRWAASPAAKPADTPLPHPPPRRTTPTTVDNDGTVRSAGLRIHIGVEWARLPAVVQISGTHANVFVNGQLIRHLRIDPKRNYQPSGRKRGGPTKARLAS